MRKPTYTEIYTYNNLLWLAIVVFGFFPFLNNFVLQMIRLSVTGNIAYGSLSNWIGYFQEGMSLVSTYLGLGVLAICLTCFGKNARGVIYLTFGSHGITFFASLFTYFIYGGNNIGPAVFMLFTDAVINEAIYFLIYFIILKVSEKKNTFMTFPKFKFPPIDFHHTYVRAFIIGAAVFGGAQLLTVLYTMISDFLDPSLGVPVNTRDIFYWVFEYVFVVVHTMIGFFVMLLSAVLTEKYLRSGKEKL